MLRITTLQIDLIWENKVANISKLTHMLKNISPRQTDLIVLPEMFTTGFSMSPEHFAESLQGDTFNFLKYQSKLLDAAITGSFICLENGKYYNRLIWVQPDGVYYTYDKRHLFGFGRENDFYTEGSERLVVDWRGWRICPLICYDLRFPVWSRNTPPYFDVLIYVANWPERRRFAWQALLTARAIENQVYVVGVNRVGVDGQGIQHAGDTMMIDYSGACLFTRSQTEGIDHAIFLREKMTTYRHKFGFLSDQDIFNFLV